MDQHQKLFPWLMTPESEKKSQIIVVLRHGYGSKKGIHLIINAKNEKDFKIDYNEMDIDNFLLNISFKNTKAVIFHNSDHDNDNKYSGIEDDIKMREKISNFLQQKKVPYLFTGSNTFAAMTALMRLNHIPKDDERILIINNMIDQFTVIELLRGYQGYAIIEKREIQCPDDCTNYKKLRSDILGENKATKIFVNSLVPTQKMNSKMNEKLKHHILKNETYIINEDDHIFSNNPMEGLAKAACAIVQNMYNPSYTLYHIIPSCHSDYCVSKKKSFNNSKDILTFANKYMTLPRTIWKSIDTTDEPFYIFCYDKKKQQYKNVKTVEFKPYRNLINEKMELCFYIDENDIPFLYHKTLTEGELLKLTCKFPVIGFFRNLSYIRLKRESATTFCDRYYFLEDWSDKFGKETFLSFQGKGPKLISKIDDSCNIKSIIKIQDIIKVMSMPSNKIVIDPKWNFEITSNSENPVLIAFENFNGEFSAASPALLMAFIVKNMLKHIRKSTKVKLNQIGIYLIDKNENGEFNKDEKERIENGFQEACKLLKIEYASSEEISKTRPLSAIFID